MARHCPKCGSVEIRRSGSRASEAKGHPLQSPYRCLRCRERFWVVSRNVRVSVAILATMIVSGSAILAAALWIIDRDASSAQQQSLKEGQMEAPAALEPVMKLPAVLEDHRMPDEPPLLRDALSQRKP